MAGDLKNTEVPVVKFALGLLLLTIVATIWFSPFSYRAIMGDDLNAIMLSQNGGFASSFLGAFSRAPMNKYRPLTDLVFRAEILLFGKEMLRYIKLNFFIELVNAATLAFICWRVSRRKMPVALLGGIAFLVSRFAYYNIVQIFGGALEGVALFFVLLQICMVVLAYQTRENKYLLLATACYACALFTHERFMVTGAFIFFSIVLAPIDYRQRFTRYCLAGIPVFILVLNFSLKVFWLKSRFFEGGGGTAIAFDFHQFLTFFGDGLLNICGFNVGPDYLSGIDISLVGVRGVVLGVYFSTCIAALIWFSGAGRDKGVIDKKIAFLFCTLFIPLVAAASITIRQEYRWLYAPYAVFIVAICYTLGCVKSKLMHAVLLCVTLMAAVNIEAYYRQFNDNIYFFAALRTAQSARIKMIDNSIAHPEKKIYFFKASDTVKKWVFQGDDFIRYYSGNPAIHVNYINDVSVIPVNDIYMHKVFVYMLDPYREVIDGTDTIRNYLMSPK